VGSPEVTVLEDDWTVATIDGSVAAHWEHSVALTDSGPVVLTAEDGGVTRLALMGITVGDLG
jgi:methionyl aminopeptidase